MIIKKLNKMLDDIERVNKARINERREPEVGIFWVFPDSKEPLINSTPISEAENYGGDFLIHKIDHSSYWQAIKHIYKSREDYDYYPRGRVVYSIKEDKYYIYADKCINENMISKIISKMHLPFSKYIVKSDIHYQCHTCNSDYAR